MPHSTYVVCSTYGEFYDFDDPGLVALFMFDKSEEIWSVYKWEGSEWLLVPLEGEITIREPKEAVLEAGAYE